MSEIAELRKELQQLKERINTIEERINILEPNIIADPDQIFITNHNSIPKDCPGCFDNQSNQMAHMMPGGCLYDNFT